MTGEVTPKQNSQRRFSRYAQRYVDSPAHAQGDDLDHMQALAQPQPDWWVLDVATGGGHTAWRFAPLVQRVIAADLAPAMLRAAREHHLQSDPGVALDYTAADAEVLPFATASFDLVTCRIAPHHFPEPQHFLFEAARSLKPGGYLLVQDHVLPEDPSTGELIDHFERTRDPSHVRAFSQSHWEAMFLQARLRVLHTLVIPKRHAFYPWAERQECPPETIQELENILASLPEMANAWLEPQGLGTPQASFINRHLLILGQLTI